jgi:hypothetical protein
VGCTSSRERHGDAADGAVALDDVDDAPSAEVRRCEPLHEPKGLGYIGCDDDDAER